MKILSGLKLIELEKIMEELGATKFRAKQVHNWVYSKSVSSIDEMTNLSKDFREKLKTIAVVSDTKIKVKQVSSDGTIIRIPVKDISILGRNTAHAPDAILETSISRSPLK